MADEQHVPYAEPMDPTNSLSTSSLIHDAEEPAALSSTAYSSSIASPPPFNRTRTMADNKSPIHTTSSEPVGDHDSPPDIQTASYDATRSSAMKTFLWIANGLGLRDHEVAKVGDLPIGEARRKHHLYAVDIIALVVVLICLLISIVVIAPGPIPWRLGLKRQLQVVGLMLSVMDMCRRVPAPKVFLMAEARFGKSYLQNYDAILTNSVLVTHTVILWRIILLSLIFLPTGLSLAYKEFFEGSSSLTLKNTGGYYGLTAPGSLATAGGTPTGGIIGVSTMVNATLPYIQAAANDSIPPPFQELPKAYGFNTLLLSNTSSAFLDAPMPDYVSSIQRNLSAGETWTITAQVHAFVTTYNSTPESHRDDDDFWKPLFNTTNEPGSIFVGTGSRGVADLYNNFSLELLVNNFNHENTSWCFLALARRVGDGDVAFQASALEFDTRRDLCDGQWLVTNDSIQLVNGSCNYPPLPDSDQLIITNNSLAFSTYYIPILSEFLGPFSYAARNQSSWQIPTFTTVVAGMYWSRILAHNGYYAWGPDKSLDLGGGPYAFSRSEVYYHINDHIVSTKTTMNTSWLLYLVLCIQPFLTIAAYLAARLFYKTPISSGFGMIAILAGVRKETLRLLWGASMSGRVSKPVRMQIAVDDPHVTTGKPAPPEIEYILGGQDANDSLSSTLRYRSPMIANILQRSQATLARSGTQYEMISR